MALCSPPSPHPTPPDTMLKIHMHTHFVRNYIAQAPDNPILPVHPYAIDFSELELTRAQRVILTRLRCGLHPALGHYKHLRNHSDPKQSHFCRRPCTFDTSIHLGMHCTPSITLRSDDVGTLLPWGISGPGPPRVWATSGR